jgi:hypothetical protein
MPVLFAGGVDCALEVLAVEDECADEFTGFVAEVFAVFVEAVAGVLPFVFVVPVADVGGVAELFAVGAGVAAAPETLDAAGAVVALDALLSVVLDFFEREGFFVVPSTAEDAALGLVVSMVVVGAAAVSAAPPAAACDFFEVSFGVVVVFVLSVDVLSVEAVALLPVAPAAFLPCLLFLDDVEALDELSVVDVVALLSVESVGAFFFFFVLLVLVSV